MNELAARARLARERQVPWDDARAERVARRATAARAERRTGFGQLLVMSGASAAIVLLSCGARYVVIERAPREGTSAEFAPAEVPSLTSDDSEIGPLGDGGLEASAELAP